MPGEARDVYAAARQREWKAPPGGYQFSRDDSNRSLKNPPPGPCFACGSPMHWMSRFGPHPTIILFLFLFLSTFRQGPDRITRPGAMARCGPGARLQDTPLTQLPLWHLRLYSICSSSQYSLASPSHSQSPAHTQTRRTLYKASHCSFAWHRRTYQSCRNQCWLEGTRRFRYGLDSYSDSYSVTHFPCVSVSDCKLAH